MGVAEMTFSSLLSQELEAVTEAGLYESREAFLSHAVETLFAARPDLRETVACKLYEKGVLSLGGAAEWARVSIEDLKEALHRLGISREAPEDPSETEDMALETIRRAGRSAR
jgi:predicted HTH domain antitoxin